ncbi:2-hydroxymuconate tautomerase [Desulfitibacter alkalitolerans]|uniref:2-hydroxymuconate tautomerase n=1 Tax=Desulfitibacter alkalitolerans TaxID=264641 RepID=UPI00047FA397|nr:2-hydroxymuconate tautomerase [Desulfitibacter alkalitolerans]
MPIVRVDMLEGRTTEQKRVLVEKITEAVCTSVGVPPERVTVVIQDVPKTNLGSAGKLRIDME